MLTHGRALLIQFSKLQGISLGEVQRGEQRQIIMGHFENGALKRAAYIKRRDDELVAVLPDEAIPHEHDVWPLLVFSLDRGSVGAAGSSFLENSEDSRYLFFTIYDKIHQLIRDNKNGIAKAGFSETLIQSSHIWSLNYKPFNSGQWFEVKKSFLERFLANHTHDSPLFIKYVDKLSESWNEPYHGTSEEREVIFRRLARMNSFTNKGPVGKQMRWFSWNGLFIYHIDEARCVTARNYYSFISY